MGGYVRLAVSERREVVAELAAEGLSQRQIAAAVGVTQMTVSRDLNETNVSETPENDADSETNVSPDSICLNADEAALLYKQTRAAFCH